MHIRFSLVSLIVFNYIKSPVLTPKKVFKKYVNCTSAVELYRAPQCGLRYKILPIISSVEKGLVITTLPYHKKSFDMECNRGNKEPAKRSVNESSDSNHSNRKNYNYTSQLKVY